MIRKEVFIENEEKTVALAAKFALALQEEKSSVQKTGLAIRLTGDLGAGKTTFTRALLRHLKVTSRVKSPTFELLCDYVVLENIAFHHFDFYRFASPEEFEEAGFRELYTPGAICVSEWSEKALPFLPEADMEFRIAINGLSRNISVIATTPLGEKLLETL